MPSRTTIPTSPLFCYKFLFIVLFYHIVEVISFTQHHQHQIYRHFSQHSHSLKSPLSRSKASINNKATKKDEIISSLISPTLPSQSTTNNSYSLQDERAYSQQTPHSARHFLPSHPYYHPPKKSIQNTFLPKLIRKVINPIRRPSKRTMNKRFMEGWYYRITLPEENVSFAFIFSIEDPGRREGLKKDGQSSLKCAAVQVMGPNDEYIIQADSDDTKFWAHEKSQAFGCTFEWKDNDDDRLSTSTMSTTHPALHPDEWNEQVKSGFQMLPTRLQGRVDGHDGTIGGVFDKEGSIPKLCDFDMTIHPLSGWGNDEQQGEGVDIVDSYGSGDKSITDNVVTSRWKRLKQRLKPSWFQSDGNQKSTAGWLASYAVFEPHWQVTLADARATGRSCLESTFVL